MFIDYPQRLPGSGEKFLKGLAPVWFAIYTQPRAEKKLSERLSGAGVECYLPLTRELRQWSDRKKWVEEPLLRNYLFVRIREAEAYGIRRIPGCVGFVVFGGKPAVIPNKQIEDLKTFLKDPGRRVGVTSERFEKGDRVSVVSGPLKGVEGEVVEVRGRRHIVLVFNSLGCNVMTEIANDEVLRIKNGAVPVSVF